MAAFVIWSGVSFLWAGSANSVIHHTLLWAEYSIVFVIFSSSLTDRRTFTYSIYVLGAVAVIISANCIIEYLVRENIDSVFGFRYGRYSEVWAALIPLFTAFTIRSKGNMTALSLMVTSGLLLAILFSTSRTSLAAAVLGMLILLAGSLFTRNLRANYQKSALVFGWLIALGLVTQLPVFSAQSKERPTVFGRIAISSEADVSNSLAQNIRFLFAGVGTEMVRQNPFRGVGADNFGVEFNRYRAAISESGANRELVAGNENAIPERAHNEYLQIATELGLVGASIFAVFLLAVVWFSIKSLRKSPNIYKVAAVAGIVAFLFSSAFSSYSFRLAQNGIAFIFLVALLLSGRQTSRLRASGVFLSLSLIVCLAMAIFSGSKAASQYLTHRAEIDPDLAASMRNFALAERLDQDNAAANYIAGSRLLNASDYAAAATNFQSAIDKGIGTSATHSYLISAHSLNGDERAELDAAARAVRVFPYSHFLLTRYSLLLEIAGNADQAQSYFARAQQVDQKQSETWKILIRDGSRKAAEAGRKGVGIRLLADLYPQDGLYAVLAERHILYPEERYTFPGF